jgi:hypothetical protein
MSEPYVPNIIYPNGGEHLDSGQATITWNTPIATADHRKVVFDIYFTDDFDYRSEPDWQQIATVPSTETSYLWKFGQFLRSDACRVAIRARNSRGERSDFSVSAANFSISRKKLMTPTVVSPVQGGRYDKVITIITDDKGLLGTPSQRSFFQMFYSSASQKIASTLIASDVEIGGQSVNWDITNLVPANDYVLQVFLKDDDGNVSDSVYIRDINIVHEGFFLVDTTAPIGAAAISFNNTTKKQDAFTRKTDVTVQIVAYDDTTGVHALQLSEGTNQAKPDSLSNVKRFTLSSEDDLKTVELLLQDYGANRNSDTGSIQRLYQTLIDIDDTSIADIATDPTNEVLWAVTNGASKRLCKVTDFASLLPVFEDDPTAVIVYQSMPHIGTKTDTNIASLYRFNGGDTELVKTFTESDSTINSMSVFDGNLYIGMENGIVYSFDGLNFDIVDSMANPVKSLYSDGNLLYLVQKNSTALYIFNGSEFIVAGA